MKKLLTVDELIEHVKAKGISFNYVTEEDAKRFLTENSYYMKLASYRFNYQKYPVGHKKEGNYIGLDFAYLIELFEIDNLLKELILKMCLDIEHALKTRLIYEAENNSAEDGYEIVKAYLTKNDNSTRVLDNIYKRKNNVYCGSLIEKYYPFFPIWVFVELISFGQTTYLCDIYFQKYNVLICENTLLNSVRDLRNDTAHGNCFINHLWTEGNVYDPKVKSMLKKLKIVGNNSLDKKMRNKCAYDISCLLLTYSKVVKNQKLKEARLNEMKELVNNRMIENKEWFKGNSTIIGSYIYLKKLVGYFS